MAFFFLIHTVETAEKQTSAKKPKDCGFRDYIGLFAISTGFEIEKVIEKYRKENNDYNIIMMKLIISCLILL